MPAGREIVVNKALSGSELRKIILADMERLLDNEGMLSPHLAFGRVGFTISLKIHIDNPFIPDSSIEISSKPPAWNILEKQPQLEALETIPLKDPSPANEVGATELTRTIDSPNSERLREGMPVPVVVRQQDSSTTTEQISYPPGSFPELGPGEVMIKDITEATRAAYGLVSPETIPSNVPVAPGASYDPNTLSEAERAELQKAIDLEAAKPPAAVEGENEVPSQPNNG